MDQISNIESTTLVFIAIASPMFERIISTKLKSYQRSYRAIALVGPRQSGKTTLARHCFPKHRYISLEDPDSRNRATEDPKGFLGSIDGNCVLDEVQYTPDLFSYLQKILDDKGDKRQFILTGSNSFQLNGKISQSLAGRVRLLNVLPLLRSEIPSELRAASVDETLRVGSYPRIFDENLEAYEWYSDYYNTYVQKDVRSLVNVADLAQFDRFVRICAGRASQLTQYSSIASEVGISQPTAVRWASILESSFLVFRLQPHFRNFNKRIIKSPKIYFYDTGLLCYLLRIQSANQLNGHPLRGAIFENWVVSEIYKHYFAQAKEPALYFWRDQHGHEVDLVLDNSDSLYPIEIKSGATFNSEWTAILDWFNELQSFKQSMVVYGGNESFSFKDSEVRAWSELEEAIAAV